jgi:hypothetical protein
MPEFRELFHHPSYFCMHLLMLICSSTCVLLYTELVDAALTRVH